MTNKNVKVTNYKYNYGQEENRLTIKCDAKWKADAIKGVLKMVGVSIKDEDTCTKTVQIRLPKENIREIV